MQPPETNRTCRACGSALCLRDDECPTCVSCGRRGHMKCVGHGLTSSVKLEDQFRQLESEIEKPAAPGPCKLVAFVDLPNDRVVLEIGVGGKGAYQFFFNRSKLAGFCSNLVALGMDLQRHKPARNEQVSTLPLDGRPLSATELKAALALLRNGK